MRTLFLLLALVGCDDGASSSRDMALAPYQQCEKGATEVDGEPCCANFFFQSNASCHAGDQCVGEPGGFCICRNDTWVCGDPPQGFRDGGAT